MRVTFIRHQKCYNLNPDGTMNYMRVNPPLTPEGIEGAKQLSGNYDLIILSPMSRCLETFIYSSIQGQRVVKDVFREWMQCPGDFRQHDPHTRYAEAEDEFKQRVSQGMEFLQNLHLDDICVVTHSEWIKEALKLNDIPDYGEEVIVTL